METNDDRFRGLLRLIDKQGDEIEDLKFQIKGLCTSHLMNTRTIQKFHKVVEAARMVAKACSCSPELISAVEELEKE